MIRNLLIAASAIALLATVSISTASAKIYNRPNPELVMSAGQVKVDIVNFRQRLDDSAPASAIRLLGSVHGK